MHSVFAKPGAELSPFIDRYWSWNSRVGEPLPTMMPGTGHDLIFHDGIPFSPASGPAHLICVRSRPIPLIAGGPVSFTAVRFRFGALRHFCRFGLAEFFDQSINVEDLWGAAGRRWAERILFAPDFGTRVVLMEKQLTEWLHSFLRADRWIDQVAHHLYYEHADCRLHQMVDRYPVGPRQFERVFRNALGMTPKQFHRLSRFHHTVRDLMLNPEAGTLDIALAHGYFDQPHFIHEFESFVQVSPFAFMLSRAGMSHFYNPPGSSFASQTAS